MALLSRAKTLEVLTILQETYPNAQCELNFRNPFELLIATMLSAQCTDVRVNIVTARLFEKYRGPKDYAALTSEILQEEIRDVGLFRMKAENIIATSRILLQQYDGEVPRTQEELVKLPGVGRKTANVVVSNAFDVPAIAVDTHVLRVSNRIGLAQSTTPDQTEQQLCNRIPMTLWSPAHHWLIHHGRRICHARNPKCEICPIQSYCQTYKRASAKVTRRKKRDESL